MNTVQVQIDASRVPLGDEHRIFGFEADFAHDLHCIPMVVRFKLDRCGIKLSLRQWSRFGGENRAALLIRRCDTEKEVSSYRQALMDLVGSCGGGAVVWLEADPAPAWVGDAQVPLTVTEQAARSGIRPPSASQWSRLAVIERFALLKLARSNHDNENFLPAMREFGLIS